MDKQDDGADTVWSGVTWQGCPGCIMCFSPLACSNWEWNITHRRIDLTRKASLLLCCDTPCLPSLQQILCLSCTSRMLLAHPLLAPSNCTDLSAATGSETSHIAEMDSHVRHPSFLCCDKLPAYSAADSVLIMHFLPCTSHMRLAHHLLAPSIHRFPSVPWPSPTG